MEKLKKIINKVKENKLLKTQIIIIVICLILGTLLHFTYDWSGENSFVGTFSAVKEIFNYS